MTDSSYDDFFEGVGGTPAAAFDFGGKGDLGKTVVGTVVDQFRNIVTDTSGNEKHYPDGTPIPQLVLTLQTDLRNWEGAKAPLTDGKDGPPLPPEDDDGLRRVWVKYDMRRALAKALQETGVKSGLRTNDKVAIKKSGEKKTSHPNPLPLYEAKVQRAPEPSASEEFFGSAPTEPPATKTAAPVKDNGFGDEPPF